MGRKDAGPAFTPPVEQYRKQIGKQDWKKSKKDVKLMKNRSDQDNSSTTQQIILMIGIAIGVMSLVYLFLFWYLGSVPSEQPVDSSAH